jgi:hypothetical protein
VPSLYARSKKTTRLTAAILIFALIPATTAATGPEQHQKVWTWRDRDGKVRSRTDLDSILAKHKLLVNSGASRGAKEQLRQLRLATSALGHATLRNADLRDADLRGADLSGADLAGADLSAARLQYADLQGSHLTAELSGAKFYRANLQGADLSFSKVVGADLNEANLMGALLSAANLHDANLIGADMQNATLLGADMEGALFEPQILPPVQKIASAYGLSSLTYYSNPGPLSQLRKQFQDAGYRDQERAITYVLNQEEAKRAGKLERYFKYSAFDLTCQYGLSPGRPLRILLILWLAFSFLYTAFMHGSGPSGIYFVGTRLWRGITNTQAIQIRPRAIASAKWWKLPFLWLRREWRMLRAALFFSLMSAFNIGFRDINFGRWLRLLTKREYDLKAVGWARTVSGFQSLLSVYLIALWILSYFGRPFG